MKSELTLAFNEITERFGLPRDTVMEALEAAMVSAYRRSVNASSQQSVEAEIDLATGQVTIYSEKEVVEDIESPQTETTLEKAREVDPEAQLGDLVIVESTPKDFGRVAAQTAKQVILQRLREAERDAQYEEFIEREGDMVHGTVHSITPQAVTVGLGRAEAILPRKHQIPGERFRVRDRIRVYVLEVRKSSRGPVIVVSRSHPNMLRRLLEMEVPEINQGLVEIKSIAREAGKRAKVAVAALREGVDPVGACVGLRGVRIQSIVRDLNDEKIDVIEWNPDPATFIAKALSPARVSGVYLEENTERGNTAMVVVPEDQLSLAIGRAGVNARLSAKLTGWRIDIKSLPEAASEALQRLQIDEDYADIAEREAESMLEVEAILAKKMEGRPVMPEEYKVLSEFVQAVQKELHGRREAERKARIAHREAIKEEIPPSVFELPLEEAELSTRVFNLLEGEDYSTVGDVWLDLEIDEDRILGLDGVGPKSMQEIRATFESLREAAPPEERKPEEGMAEAHVPEAEAEGVVVETGPAAEEAIPSAEPSEVPLTPSEQAVVEEAAMAEEELAEIIEEEEELAAEAAEVEEAAAAEEAEEEVEGEEEEEEEEELDIAEVFAEAEEAVEEGEYLGEDEELEEIERERGKKKRRSRIMEYDPEVGEVVVRRRRKREDQEDWERYLDT
jgi:N utilization substance protein A